MIKFKTQLFVVISILLFNSIKALTLWPNHDISTLRLLQVVHRHGDRTPIKFMPNDPFSNVTLYWPEGTGELTLEGKYRMYKLGQFIRQEYNEFLGSEYSPREVYARSSLSSRCLESVSCLLSGAYPPNTTQWQWNKDSNSELGLHWQPFPIESFIPKQNDSLLDVDKDCPKADKQLNKIYNSEPVLRALAENREFLSNLSKYVGLEVNTLRIVNRLYEDIRIEQNRGYKWSDMNRWSPQYETKVFEKLSPLAQLLWNVEWDDQLIQRVRAGYLIEELVQNFDKYVNDKPIKNSLGKPYKLMVYSTHDTKLAVLMSALNIFNNQLIPFGASLLFELHQSSDSNNYFIKIYYFNQTLPNSSPNLMTLPDCANRDNCPFDQFLKLTKNLMPSDWNSECGIINLKETIFISNIVALVINLFLLLTLSALIVYYWVHRNRSSEYTPLANH